MNSFLEIFGISIIIILSAYFARLLYINQNGKSMPGTKRKQQIFKKIWMWKNQGLSYDELNPIDGIIPFFDTLNLIFNAT
jgi:hypothetical protein